LNRACINSPGSFTCGECTSGYAEDSHDGCADIDECADNNAVCAGLPCYNEVGSFRCGQCEIGFQPTTDNECQDIDECATSNNQCNSLFEGLRPCVNVPGSYTCGDCVTGYVQNYNGFCEDVDECQAPLDSGFCNHEVVQYEWIDAQHHGDLAPSLNDDDHFDMALPFKFSFFGDIKESISVSSNGYVFFAGNTLSYGASAPIPTGTVPNDIIAPYWTDLDPTTCGAIYTYFNEDVFVVEWVDIPFFVTNSQSCSGPNVHPQHFEVVLYRDGRIKFQYASISPSTNSWAHASIGVENADGVWGHRVAYCIGACPAESGVDSGSAVLLTPCRATPADCSATSGCESNGDGRWSWPCPDHAACTNSVGNFTCVCGDGFDNGIDCTPQSCTTGLVIRGSNRNSDNPCSGTTGDVCEYTCLNDRIQFGEHICTGNGEFLGGACISQCHTLQIDGDCFSTYNGLYELVSDPYNGQSQYVKSDGQAPDDTHLYFDGVTWNLGTLSTAGNPVPEPHSVCSSCADGDSSNLVEGVLGTHLWQVSCGSSVAMGRSIDVTCMVLCSNTCDSANNGVCEDGGDNSASNSCYYGTDCHDCGSRDTEQSGRCDETPDAGGFVCSDYILAGYTCLQMVTIYGADCSCTC